MQFYNNEGAGPVFFLIAFFFFSCTTTIEKAEKMGEGWRDEE